MKALGADARRVCDTHRERSFASPAPVALPLLSAVLIVAITALAAAGFGLSVGAEVAADLSAVAVAVVVAHRTLLSLCAGLVLVLVRPYSPGERVRLRCRAAGGELDAVIVHIGAANTTLATDSGVLVLPNHRLLKDVPEPPSA